MIFQAAMTRRPKTAAAMVESPSKTKRDPLKPKKAMTSFMLFMQDFRKKNANKGWDIKTMVKNGECNQSSMESGLLR